MSALATIRETPGLDAYLERAGVIARLADSYDERPGFDELRVFVRRGI